MKSLNLYSVLVLTIALIPFSAMAYVFTTSLKEGDTAYDVLELQKVLNSDPATALSGGGVGTFGQETLFFGAKTKEAVIRFQEKYKEDILFPSGLLRGTGFVGPATIKKLNSLSSMIVQISPSPLPSLPSSPPPSPALAPVLTIPTEKVDVYEMDNKLKNFNQKIVDEINQAVKQRREPKLEFVNDFSKEIASESVAISSISAQAAKPGNTIQLQGIGFTSTGNMVYLGSGSENEAYSIPNLSSQNGTIRFVVPELPRQRYDLVVKNSRGMSVSHFFIIKNDTSPVVSVTSISPQSFSYGDTVTITGSGFSEKNNEIFTLYGRVKGVSSSDGKTLKFVYKPTSFENVPNARGERREVRVGFAVVNDFGFSTTGVFGMLKY